MLRHVKDVIKDIFVNRNTNDPSVRVKVSNSGDGEAIPVTGSVPVSGETVVKDETTGNAAEVVDNKLQTKSDPADTRLNQVYLARILEELEKLNIYMKVITDEEIEELD